MKAFYILSGYLSIAIALFAVILMFRIETLRFAVACSILGFLFGLTNIFLNIKFFYDRERFPKGYLGIFFSSLPILFLLIIIFKYKS